MHRTRALTLAVAASTALTLTACGSDSLSESDSSSAPTTSASAATVDEALAAKLPEKIKSAGKVVIGTDATYQPNEYLDTDGKTVIGMDVELFDAVMAKFGVKTEWVPSAFDSIILGVQSGKYDIGVSSFTINTERLKPWHTLSGRMHFFLDHDWMRDVGEALPQYRPPLDMHRLFGEPRLGQDGAMEVVVRYLTPHSKWSIHSEYQDNLLMLSLSRGGPTVWMSPADAAAIEVSDNDWVECVNVNGVLVARAIVSHRMPAGVVYTTFHHPVTGANVVTTENSDWATNCPEYR